MSICKEKKSWRSDCHLFLKSFRKSSDFLSLKEKQEGVCAICSRLPGKKDLSIDHDHVTGQIRGLLCPSCNVMLGFIDNEDWFFKALSYKERGKKSEVLLENYPPPTSEEFREKMSKIAKDVQNRPEVREKRNSAQRAAMRDPAVRLKMSNGQKVAWTLRREK